MLLLGITFGLSVLLVSMDVFVQVCGIMMMHFTYVWWPI